MNNIIQYKKYNWRKGDVMERNELLKILEKSNKENHEYS